MDADVSSELTGNAPTERAALWEEWPSLVLLAGLWAFSLWAWPRLPERIPVHWGLHGEANGWATPREAALLLPSLLTSVYGFSLLFFNARFDFKMARRMDPAVSRRVRFLLVCLLVVVHGLVLGAPLRGTTLKAGGLDPVLALFFILLGNVMPRLEPNAWAGIRIPPTLEDRIVWKRTHRLAGKLFVLSGLLQLLACLLPQTLSQPVILALILLAVLIPTAYAYRIRSAQEAP